MGIRGAWSLISNDPRRFGQSCRLSPQEASTVLVDGPSLLYHIAITELYDEFPPIFKAQIQQPSLHYQASPATIYQRTRHFLLSLVSVAGPVDGLAATCKIPTQVDRLRNMAHQGNA